jgi:sec-independent protein translocase protein TatC
MRHVSRNAEMPFLDHLEELRWRIIYSLAAILMAIAIGFFVVMHYDILGKLEAPIIPFLHGHHVVATHPADGLQISISAAMWIGAVLAFPVIVYQAWLFLSPALYRGEKRLLIAALAGGIVLFVTGALFAFVVVLPMSLPWLFDLFGTALGPMITAESYFGFVFSMVITFGLAFELPVVVLLLAAAGLVTPRFLNRYRRHAVVIIVAASAILTPGDYVWSTILLSVPLYLLYELSVLATYVIWRNRPVARESVAILLAPLLLLRRNAVNARATTP